MYYFDHAATSPMTAAALESYLQTAKNYSGNPSSSHQAGRQARGLLEYCRLQLATELGYPTESLLFTGGGTQGNYLALATLLAALPAERREVLVSPLEHASIQHFLQGQEDLQIRRLPLDHGCVTPSGLADALTEETGLVILQQVNSVTGLIQPIEELVAITSAKGIFFHCDCVQSMGKIPLPQGVSSFSGAGHKFGGPKGSGIVYFDPQLGVAPLYPDVHQERGYYGGTEDLPGIVALTTALLDSLKVCDQQNNRYRQFRQLIKEQLTDWHLLEGAGQYPGICGLLSPGVAGETIMVALDQLGYAVSVASACNTHRKQEPALTALGLTEEENRRFLRVSFGAKHQKTDVLRLCQELQKF